MMKRQAMIVFISIVILVVCGLLQADPFSNPADINNSGTVDSNDLAIFAAAWLSDDTPTGNWNSACDISDPNDGFIDGPDFAVLFANWLWSVPNRPDPNEFAYIPAGTFEMGDHHDGMSWALPIHTVTLDSFYMSKYEITNRQYCDYLNSAIDANDIKVSNGIVYAADDTSNDFPYCSTSSAPTGKPDWGEYSQINYSGSIFSVNIKDGTTDMSNHPMVMVSWYGSVAYCNWKSQQEGLEVCYDTNDPNRHCDFTVNGFRLPTEAEWEYAGRGGEHSPYYRYPWGNTIGPNQANYGLTGDPYETGAYPWTTPVGYYDGGQIPAGVDMANGYGLYDMAGNVWEWVNDWYDLSYYSTSPENNPTGPASGSSRIVRSGYWFYWDYFSRVAYRYVILDLDFRNYSVGFRVCVFASH